MKIVNRVRDPGIIAEDLLMAAGYKCYTTGCLGSMWEKGSSNVEVFWNQPIEGRVDGWSINLEEPGGLRLFLGALL